MFSPNLSSPLWALFCPRAGLELFSYTHTGRRPESVANRQFIPPPPITSARSTKLSTSSSQEDSDSSVARGEEGGIV